MSQTYGYIRVCTREQNEDRQLTALSTYNIPKKNLFLDKLSGKDFERPAYKRLLKKLRPGDLLIVKSIDRLGSFIADLVPQILSYVAHTERENIHQRQAEGIAAAKARGVRFGIPAKEFPPDFDSLYASWRSGEISGDELAARCGMALGAVYRKLHQQGIHLQDKRKKGTP